jgi:hypothetical protein
MRIITSADDSSISISMANNEDSVHIEIGEGRDSIHHLYTHPDNVIRIEHKQSKKEGWPSQFIVRVQY